MGRRAAGSAQRCDGVTEAMSAFFAMNGYGFYIWSAYGIAALTVVIEVALLRSHRRLALAQARSTLPEPASDPVAATE
jgi:heme exporter protein CcmD